MFALRVYVQVNMSHVSAGDSSMLSNQTGCPEEGYYVDPHLTVETLIFFIPSSFLRELV